MIKYLRRLNSTEIDFRPYRQKENDFKRLAGINIVVCLFIAPLFSFWIKNSDLSSVYFYLGMSYALIFPIYILLCYWINAFRDKLFYFFLLHIFAMTAVAFMDLVENSFPMIDVFAFFSLYTISILVIQRFYFGIVYILFVLSLFIYGLQFVVEIQDISKGTIFGFFFTISTSSALAMYAKNKMLSSVFDFNRYLKKLSQGDKFGFFLLRRDAEKFTVLDFNSDIASLITAVQQPKKEELETIINGTLNAEDIASMAELTEDQNLTRIIQFGSYSFELVISLIILKGQSYYLIKATNITERVKEQEELILSEQKYRHLYNENQSGVFSLNDQFELVNFNQSFERMFDGVRHMSLIFGDKDEMNYIQEIVKEKQTFNNYQTHLTFPDGSIKWFVFNFYFDSKNNVIEGTVVDVSDIQKANEALRKSEEKYKLIYEESNDAILLLDGDRITDVNRRAMQLFGLPKDVFVQRNFWDLTYEKNDVNADVFKKVKQRLKSFGTVKFNWTFNGRFNPIEGEVALVEIIIGKQIFHQCVIHDVTEKNANIRALEKSTLNFKSALDSTPEGILIIKDREILYFNPEVMNMLGEKEVDLSRLFLEDDQILFERYLTQKEENDNAVQCQLNLNGQNSPVLVDLTMVNTFFGGTSAVLIIMKDISLQIQLSREMLRAEMAEETTKRLENEITERIKTEKELQNLLLKTQSIYDSSSNLFLMTLDVNGVITYVNKHSTNFFSGFSLEDLKRGISLSDYFRDWFNPDEIIIFEQILNKVSQGQSRQFELNLTKDSTSRWLEVFLNPIYDMDGQISELSLICHDITMKKESEQQTMESLKEKEVLLKEIHHRVKNNLQVISSILNLQSSFVADKKTLEILQESRNRIRSMAIIHENLYRTTNFSSIDFKGYLHNLVINLTSLFRNEHIQIGIHYDLQQVDISLDQAVPSGLLMNELITNSLKYAFVDSKRVDNQLLISMKEEEGKIFLRVKDNGKGLPKDFNLSQTDTLGLQLVVTLVEQLDGDLTFNSDGGTDFLISFDKI